MAGLLPQTAFATDTSKAIQLGTSGISDPTSTQNNRGTYYKPSDYVYFGVKGSDPIKWRVLDADKTNDGTTSGMFLLSEYLLDSGVVFESAWNSDDNDGQINPNEWQHSDAQNWCSTFATNTDVFSTAEQAAFLGVAKTDSAESSLYSIPWGASSLTENDKVFFLSVRELADYVGSYDGAPGLSATDTAQSAGSWWLRSPDAGSMGRYAGLVDDRGIMFSKHVDGVWAARPAFNLNLNSVLFTSAAEGGKSSGAVGADALQSVSEYAENEWKLTLLDSGRQFSVTEKNASGNPGETITLNYTGATTGTNEYISVLLTDQQDNALYYGRVAQPQEENGTVEVAIPTDLALGQYTLNVFNEQYNGNYKTDYASAFATVDLTVEDTIAPTLSGGSATRTSETTATVKFISDEAGEYFYEVVESGTTAPTINTAGAGTACASGENTISLTSLSGAGAKDIYIVAKDAIGNVSQSLKISIPEYIAPSYSISATPSALDFGSMTEDYSSAPAAQTVTIQNTGNQTITLNQPAADDFNVGALSATELTAGGTATFTVQPKTGLGAGDYSETLVISGSNSTSASVELSFIVNAVYTLTVNLNGGNGGTTGGAYAEGAVINIDAGSRSNYRFNGWTSSNGGTFADTSSASTTFTMPAADTTITANWQYNGGGGGSSRPSTPSTPTGPATGESGGWEEIGDEIGEAQPGETIVVDMNGTTEVPAEIFEEVAGKDVTVEFDLGGGISWTVNGQDVPTGASFQSLNLGVDMGTSGISANVINNITGEYGSVQITLAHDGEFGFALTLTAPLGSDNAGHWANLYYYHEDSEALTFQTSGRIGADGNVSLRFTHASQYAIVIDDYDHGAEDLPFTDVAEGAWYYDAVSYVYAEGLMAGTSDTTFSPDITTSRAMIAVILWRLEGSPTVDAYTDFSDVADGAWYTEGVRWASSVGVVGGYPNGSFGPNDPITREQLAVMLYRYADYKGWDVTELADLSAFTDAESISGYAVTALRWANAAGIVGGYNDSTLRPQGNARRSEAAAMLQRFCEAYIDSEE